VSHKKSYSKAEKAFSGGDYATALMLYRQIFAEDPDETDAVWGVAECFHSLGEISLAIEWYRKYLELEPDEPEALHMLAALGEGTAPSRASDDYVTAHFDRFAEDFDKQLLEELDYRAPDLLADTLETHAGPAKGKLAILDAGCGTGLCGPRLKPYAARLDGVDLSGEMLKYARRRKAYDKLFEEELGHHLSRARRRYDVILAADTVCYFGDLTKLFKSAARVLKSGGLFIFSVEAGDKDADFELTQSGRYTHGKSYIRKVAKKAGLKEAAVDTETLRTEYGEPVAGDIWVLSKPGKPGK